MSHPSEPAAVAQAAADLTAWLPRVAALIAEPDTGASTRSRGKPHSQPPWNTANASALFDALEGIRRLHAAIRYEVTGRHTPPSPHSQTGATLAAIPKLAAAASDETRTETVWLLTRYTTAILQLPAVDLEERPQRISAACPYCQRPMLRLFPRDGRLTCLAFGACFDGDGRHPVGHMTVGQASGEPYVLWADGTVQIPPPPEGTTP